MIELPFSFIKVPFYIFNSNNLSSIQRTQDHHTSRIHGLYLISLKNHFDTVKCSKLSKNIPPLNFILVQENGALDAQLSDQNSFPFEKERFTKVEWTLQLLKTLKCHNVSPFALKLQLPDLSPSFPVKLKEKPCSRQAPILPVVPFSLQRRL